MGQEMGKAEGRAVSTHQGQRRYHLKLMDQKMLGDKWWQHSFSIFSNSHKDRATDNKTKKT
jgi:hypothetical protein